MFGPDVVVEGTTNILLLGSGDREKPLNTSNTTTNYFFMLKDEPTITTYLSAESSTICPGQSLLCLNSLLPVTNGTIATTVQLNSKKGWYLGLHANEQVVNAAVAVYGTVYFGTHEPTVPVAGTCSANLGTTRYYTVSYTNGAKPGGTTDVPYTSCTTCGLTSDPVVVKVDIDGKQVPVCLGCSKPLTPDEIKKGGSSSNPAKVRSYWYIKK
jgi:type IV pilus assembly protein PilY1